MKNYNGSHHIWNKNEIFLFGLKSNIKEISDAHIWAKILNFKEIVSKSIGSEILTFLCFHPIYDQSKITLILTKKFSVSQNSEKKTTVLQLFFLVFIKFFCNM